MAKADLRMNPDAQQSLSEQKPHPFSFSFNSIQLFHAEQNDVKRAE
jgi:hypothetical protein